MQAAKISNDEVYQRLWTVEDTLSYHMNNTCYQGYTKQRALDRIKAKAEQQRSILEAGPELLDSAPKKKAIDGMSICYTLSKRFVGGIKQYIQK